MTSLFFDLCLVPYIRAFLQIIYTGILPSDSAFLQYFFYPDVKENAFLASYRILMSCMQLRFFKRPWMWGYSSVVERLTANCHRTGNAATILKAPFWYKHHCPSWKIWLQTFPPVLTLFFHSFVKNLEISIGLPSSTQWPNCYGFCSAERKAVDPWALIVKRDDSTLHRK